MSMRIGALIIASLATSVALAAVSSEEAKQLGATLTPWGAEKAGNKEGTIPAYAPENLKAPAGYDPLKSNLPDPWNEKPLFSITAQNYKQYAEKLSEGHQELFRKNPNFRMDIYPTHRTVQYPKYILNNSIKNANECKDEDGEMRLTGCWGGIPFPIPKTAMQVMWNHLMRYSLYSWHVNGTSWLTAANGKPILQAQNDLTQQVPFFDPSRNGPAPAGELYLQLRTDYQAPSRKVGEKLLILDSIDPFNPGRRAYSYIPGQRRVKLAPDLAYDTPSPVSGGAATMDEAVLFFGAPDRYDFKLLGKKEMFIMYNTFKKNDSKACPPEVLYSTGGYSNPDCIRWELHRVWVIGATLKPGFRHVLPKRTFYFDEDTWAAGTAESYDAAGKLYRVGDMPFFPLYHLGYGHALDTTQHYDLQTGLHHETICLSHPGGFATESKPQPKTFFSPEALAGEGVR